MGFSDYVRVTEIPSKSLVASPATKPFIVNWTAPSNFRVRDTLETHKRVSAGGDSRLDARHGPFIGRSTKRLEVLNLALA